MRETARVPTKIRKPSLARRFDRGVARWGAAKEDCWLWIGCRTRAGYGLIGHGGRLIYTHRVAWALTIGPIPDGLWVLHKCDNPPCVNPAHLFLGTNRDNMIDMARKGRQGGTKLTAEQVRQIRFRCSEGIPQRKVAAQYGVTQAMVSLLHRRQWWKEVK